MFKNIKLLWKSCFNTTKEQNEQVKRFNYIADIASRGCLFIGGLTSMGFTYLITYPIYMNIFSNGYVSLSLTILSILFVFFIFDILLGVTFPMFTTMLVDGKFKTNKNMRISGVLLFVISVSIASVSIMCTINGAEVPVITSINKKLETTQSDYLKLQSNLGVASIIESYDKSLEKAKEDDEYNIDKLKKNGSDLVTDTKEKYSNPIYSPLKLKRKVIEAKKDSANLVDSYESLYYKILSDKDKLISSEQNNFSQISSIEGETNEKIDMLFQKKSEITVYFIRIVGILGTVLFMFIKIVQSYLNNGLENTKKDRDNDRKNYSKFRNEKYGKYNSLKNNNNNYE